MKKTELKKIGLVLSLFNLDISARLKEGALDELKKTGIHNFEIREVPGVVEIPLSAQWLFQKNYQAVIALGAVIRGETTHFDACCRMVEQGCMQVQLKMNRPIIFGILMTESKEQALARSGGEKGHIARLSVQTALKMLSFLEEEQRQEQ
ncbi:MAG: 6,7-dimethyl-8-ribityllumazine synthase [Oligoflexia bacterium]|nr:6,7-dimethyl-8-ribityllumazine synthase [Oligoflexia bacterium]